MQQGDGRACGFRVLTYVDVAGESCVWLAASCQPKRASCCALIFVSVAVAEQRLQ